MQYVRIDYCRARCQRRARFIGGGFKRIRLSESHLRGRIWQGIQLILRGRDFELRALKPRTRMAGALA